MVLRWLTANFLNRTGIKMTLPMVTVVIPSFNQAQYLDAAIRSVFEQSLPVEVFVLDGGSSDGSVDIIKKWQDRLSGWRSHADNGQASAINEGVALGSAPFVCWLNSDDFFEPGGLKALLAAFMECPDAPAVYGRAWNLKQRTGKKSPIWVERFDTDRLAKRCIISQPATLISRRAWESVGGVDPVLHMTMDYDLWWRLLRQCGPLVFVDRFVATNREHDDTKTRTLRRRHYQEAIQTVRQYYGKVPLRWWLAWPYSVWFKALQNRYVR